MKLYCLVILFSIVGGIAAAQSSLHFGDVNINSIASDDFNDLRAIDSLIKGKRVVFLGESQHGINDFNLLKFRLIRYLHQQHGFDIVAFESAIANCGLTNAVKDSLTGLEMLTRALSGVWRVKGNCSLMNYIRDQNMEFAGLDINDTGLGLTSNGYNIILHNIVLSKRFAKADSLLLYSYESPRSKWYHQDVPFSLSKLDSIRISLKLEYSSLLHDVLSLKTLEEKYSALFRKIVDMRLVQLSTSLNRKDKNYFVTNRDKFMSNSLEYLLDSVYQGRKIIVWAHNAHIAKRGAPLINDGEAMGKYLSQRTKDSSLVIGLFATSGFCSWGAQKPVAIEVKRDAVEDTYGKFSSKGLLIAAATLKKNQYYQGIPSIYAPVKEQYDALLFVQQVDGSSLIRYNKEFKCE